MKRFTIESVGIESNANPVNEDEVIIRMEISIPKHRGRKLQFKSQPLDSQLAEAMVAALKEGDPWRQLASKG